MTKSFPAEIGSVSEILKFTSGYFRINKVQKSLSSEYQLLLEEIALKLISCADEGDSISVTTRNWIHSMTVTFNCPGRQVTLGAESDADFGGIILEEFSDHLRQTYSSRINHIKFSSGTFNNITLYSAISFVLALAAIFVLNNFWSADDLEWLCSEIVYPVSDLFINLIKILATPVAFLSLTNFLIETGKTLGLDRRTFSIAGKYLFMSILAISFAFLLWFFVKPYIRSEELIDSNVVNFLGNNPKEFISNLTGDTILYPFTLSNPIPLLLSSVLTGISIGQIFGKEGSFLVDAVSSFNSLFCRMLNLAYGVLPLFVFTSVLYMWISGGWKEIIVCFWLVLSLVLCMVLFFGVYFILLAVSGVNPFEFFKKYSRVIIENIRIGSNADALPYNRRVLLRKEHIQRLYLNESLSLGVAMNMNGSCLVVTAAVLFQISWSKISISSSEMLIMIIILILLSIGAPNQPGSFMICISVLAGYLGLPDSELPKFLIVEAFLGKLYSSVNSIGDIVTIVSDWNVLKQRT